MAETLFDVETLDAPDATPYKPGTFWTFSYTRPDENQKPVRAQVAGMVVDIRTWDNQFRIDWQTHLNQSGTDSPGWAELEEYVERDWVALYTGRHAKFLGPTVFLDSIVKARLLDEPTRRIFIQEAQGWVDSWIWTADEFAEKMPEVARNTGLWWPQFTAGRQCTHSSPSWRWHRTVDGTFCQWCRERISDVSLPAGYSCMWWTYKGSLGIGRPPDNHPDECGWCNKERTDDE